MMRLLKKLKSWFGGDNQSGKSNEASRSSHVVDIPVSQHEELWAQAVADVMQEKGIDATVEVVPDGETSGYTVTPSLESKRKSPRRGNQSVQGNSSLRRAGIRLDDTFITITDPPFFGQFCRSPNKQYILCWRESVYGNTAGDIAEVGRYLLLDGAKVIAEGEMKRPQNGKVANNGNFILNDWAVQAPQFGNMDSSETFYAFSFSGEILIQQRFETASDANSISPDGQFTACIADDDSDEDDGIKLFLFDLSARTLLTKISPAHEGSSGETVIRIEPESRLVVIRYEDGPVHRYGFDGTFLDAPAWKSNRLEYASGYELLRTAEARLAKLDGSDTASSADVISLFQQALSKGVSELTQAKIHRHLGEIYQRCHENSKALDHLETALRLNPKIGVKKLIARLRAEP